jgi:hypothetical protein
MWRRFIAPTFGALGALVLAGCAGPEPNDYPARARTQFEASCPASDPVCACTWDRLTRTLTYEDYQSALARFQEEGLMDPRVTRARTHCIERHRPN